MSILFCTPAYGGMITAAHFNSCLKLKAELMATGMEHGWLVGTNESLITRARNEMTASFLASEFSHMMWLDADIEFTPEDVAKVWNLDADIAVAFYSMKRSDMPLSAWKDGRLVKIEECPNEPFEVDYAGTGFMLIRRSVIETMAKTSENYLGPNGRVPALYMTPIHNDVFESEDYNFCRRARECGFKIVGDPSICLGHIGQYRYGHA